MSIFTYPIKKSISLGARAVGTVALGAKAGIGVVEHLAREVTGGAKDDSREEPVAPTERPAVRTTPTETARAPKPKAPAKKQGDALADAAGTESDASSTAEVHPLLADEHVVPEEEVVYSSGPDIEAPIEDLTPKSDDERL